MRRYKIDAYLESGYGMYSDDEYACAKMVEDKYGEWVPFENARNAVKQLTKQIERLKKEVSKLKAAV